MSDITLRSLITPVILLASVPVWRDNRAISPGAFRTAEILNNACMETPSFYVLPGTVNRIRKQVSMAEIISWDLCSEIVENKETGRYSPLGRIDNFTFGSSDVRFVFVVYWLGVAGESAAGWWGVGSFAASCLSSLFTPPVSATPSGKVQPRREHFSSSRVSRQVEDRRA